MRSLTTGKNLQISNLLGLVKFNLKQEEEALKNSFYPKIIALFGSGASAKVFEESDSFRSEVVNLKISSFRNFARPLIKIVLEMHSRTVLTGQD